MCYIIWLNITQLKDDMNDMQSIGNSNIKWLKHSIIGIWIYIIGLIFVYIHIHYSLANKDDLVSNMSFRPTAGYIKKNHDYTFDPS